jgi:outer membrane protein OmpA-like peptidoglycan-associated protein
MLKKADTVKVLPVPMAEKLKVGANLAKVLAFSPNTIYFDYGKWNIRPDAIPEMDNIVKVMNEHPTMVVELGAHTDCRSSFEYNQRLSERRAKSSAAYIQKRITNPTRITGKGYGKTRLLNRCECEYKVLSDCTEAEHQKNRRTEFIIVKE